MSPPPPVPAMPRIGVAPQLRAGAVSNYFLLCRAPGLWDRGHQEAVGTSRQRGRANPIGERAPEGPRCAERPRCLYGVTLGCPETGGAGAAAAPFAPGRCLAPVALHPPGFARP